MSDDGVMNLEDDAAPVAPAPATPEPAAPPQAAVPSEPQAAPEEHEPDQVDGLLAALRAERAEKKALKEQASRVGELEQWRRDNEPYVQFVQNNRDLLVQRVQPPDPAPKAPEVDPDALEAARLMDFYKADGTPDVERGARYLALQDRRAQRAADSLVAPIRQQTAQEQSAMNYQRALQIKDANGETPSEDALRSVWAAMPADLAADPRVAGLLAATALGIDRMRNPRKVVVPPPPTAPLISEPSGGHPAARPSMSRFEESVAKERGISATKWQEHTKGFQAGRASALEE